LAANRKIDYNNGPAGHFDNQIINIPSLSTMGSSLRLVIIDIFLSLSDH